MWDSVREAIAGTVASGSNQARKIQRHLAILLDSPKPYGFPDLQTQTDGMADICVSFSSQDTGQTPKHEV